MHKFNVGDRVRVVLKGSIYYGETCTVIGLDVSGISLGTRYTGNQVDIPCGQDCPCMGMVPHVFEDHELVLIYDGNEKVSWSDCVWEPQGVSA